MRATRLPVFVAIVLAASVAGAQTFTGSIRGTVADEQGGAMPRATVILTGKTGTNVAITETDGTYRFAALEPGSYAATVEMSGFRPLRRENITVSIGKTARIDFTLKVGAVTGTAEVVREAAVVDVTSSATDSVLSQDLLFNLPLRRGNAASNLLDFFPGVNDGSAFGGDEGSANGLLIDGVDTRDPSGGAAWTFYNYDIVEEVRAVGPGAPAEYGAFQGAVINTLTKSGGNRYSGLFDVIYTGAGLGADNVGPEVLEQNPALGDPARTRRLVDFSAQLGGPIVEDKLFFFASAQRYYLNQDPSGPRTVRKEVSPRFNLKLTWQPTTSDSVSTHLQYDSYNIIGRSGIEEASDTDELTNREDAPEWVWLASWRHLFGSRTFAEVKYTGWTGRYDLSPEVAAPGHFDGATRLYSVSQGWFSLSDRGRHQVNASVTHHAERWGRHELKFGVEVERSRTRDRYGYIDNTYYYDFDNQPYYAYGYGYDVSGRNRRESVFVQDAWRPTGPLTLSLGVRMDRLSGGAPDREKVYGNTVLAPRLGFAFDLSGNHDTVLKGSYSQYYEGIFNDLYKLATPGYQDAIVWYMGGCPPYGPSGPTADYRCPPSARVEAERLSPPLATIDPDIGHPRVDELTIGIERAIGGSVRVAVTGVFRQNKSFVGSVLPLARWTRRAARSADTPALPAVTIPVFAWANRAESRDTILVTNPDGFRYLDPAGTVLGTVDAERRYRALMVVLSKSYAHRFRGQLSYLLSKAEGTIDNTSEGSFGISSFYQSPSRVLVNSRGRLRNDRTHELKVLAGYRIPRIELAVNIYWRALSGRTYTPFQRFGTDALNFSTYHFPASGREPLLEPRGSRRLPTESYLDLRIEKAFSIGGGGGRIGVYADITNVFNEDTVTDALTRVPATSLFVGPGDSVAVPFGAPSSVIPPRQIVLGARWSF